MPYDANEAFIENIHYYLTNYKTLYQPTNI